MIYGMHPNHAEDYTVNRFADLPVTVTEATSTLRAHIDEFDFIAVRGLSGVLVGSPVSIALGKPLVVVRKDEDCINHSFNRVENYQAAYGRYVFLDDIICSGKTRDAVRCSLTAHIVAPVNEVATYQYDHDKYTPVINP